MSPAIIQTSHAVCSTRLQGAQAEGRTFEGVLEAIPMAGESTSPHI
jgi:hypothetical protein